MTPRLALQIAAIIVVAMQLAGYPNEAWLVSVAFTASALAYRLCVDSGFRFMSKLVGILPVPSRLPAPRRADRGVELTLAHLPGAKTDAAVHSWGARHIPLADSPGVLNHGGVGADTHRA